MLIRRILKFLVIRLLPSSAADFIRAYRAHVYREKERERLRERNQHVVTAMLDSGEPIRLELAADDRRMAGWITVGLEEKADVHCDLTEPLVFPTESVTEIYCSHLLEHFGYTDLTGLLSECHRVLRADGLFKVAVPDAAVYVKAYFRPDEFNVEEYCTYQEDFQYHSKIDVINYIAYMSGYHHHLFDQEHLLVMLANAGFKDVKARPFDPELDLSVRANESIYAVAKK